MEEKTPEDSPLRKVKLLLGRPFVRYVLVGGSAYCIELLAIIIAVRMGSGNVLAVAISFWIGLVYSFLLQKFFSFGDRRTHHRIVLSQAAMVTALVIFNFTFTVLITKALQHVLPVIITRTMAIGVTTLWNFYLYKKHIFKDAVID